MRSQRSWRGTLKEKWRHQKRRGDIKSEEETSKEKIGGKRVEEKRRRPRIKRVKENAKRELDREWGTNLKERKQNNRIHQCSKYAFIYRMIG